RELPGCGVLCQALQNPPVRRVPLGGCIPISLPGRCRESWGFLPREAWTPPGKGEFPSGSGKTRAIPGRRGGDFDTVARHAPAPQWLTLMLAGFWHLDAAAASVGAR